MSLNIGTDILNWFVEVFKKVGDFFKPITDWFWEFSEPVRDFFIANERNVFLWVGIILVGLIIFELTYKALNKDK